MEKVQGQNPIKQGDSGSLVLHEKIPWSIPHGRIVDESEMRSFTKLQVLDRSQLGEINERFLLEAKRFQPLRRGYEVPTRVDEGARFLLR